MRSKCTGGWGPSPPGASQLPARHGSGRFPYDYLTPTVSHHDRALAHIPYPVSCHNNRVLRRSHGSHRPGSHDHCQSSEKPQKPNRSCSHSFFLLSFSPLPGAGSFRVGRYKKKKRGVKILLWRYQLGQLGRGSRTHGIGGWLSRQGRERTGVPKRDRRASGRRVRGNSPWDWQPLTESRGSRLLGTAGSPQRGELLLAHPGILPPPATPLRHKFGILPRGSASSRCPRGRRKGRGRRAPQPLRPLPTQPLLRHRRRHARAGPRSKPHATTEPR